MSRIHLIAALLVSSLSAATATARREHHDPKAGLTEEKKTKHGSKSLVQFSAFSLGDVFLLTTALLLSFFFLLLLLEESKTRRKVFTFHVSPNCLSKAFQN